MLGLLKTKITALLLGVMSMSMLIAQENPYTYLYIEGDLETPIYVKIEGKMLPRLHQHHFIVPNLDAGSVNLEILFQQNKYPAHHFVVNVPQGKPRGLSLIKLAKDSFALRDLQSGRWLYEGNSAEADSITKKTDIQENPESIQEERKVEKIIAEENPALTVYRRTKYDNEDSAKQEKKFLDEVQLIQEIDREESRQAVLKKYEQKVPTNNTKQKVKEVTNNEFEQVHILSPKAIHSDESNQYSGIINYDCRESMSETEFAVFSRPFVQRNDDDEWKLKYIERSANKNCFSTAQVGFLAKHLESQSSKFEFVKMLYGRVADQSNYKNLVSLFNSGYLKRKFITFTETGE